MILFPMKPKGSRRVLTTGVHCEACWRKIRDPDNAFSVLADASIAYLLPIGSTEPNGGYFAIGPECARDIPATHKTKGWEES